MDVQHTALTEAAPTHTLRLLKEYVALLNKGENRKKFVAADYPELANKTGMELMRGDWSRISRDVKRLGICSKILAEKD